MRRVVSTAVVIVLLVLAPVLSACSSGHAKELFETAKFEELQNNKKHATELYEEIIRDYPNSEYALMAEERLNKLNTP
jgi:outer membrane protein assembly factor BamD (BamD/ComL family)